MCACVWLKKKWNKWKPYSFRIKQSAHWKLLENRIRIRVALPIENRRDVRDFGVDRIGNRARIDTWIILWIWMCRVECSKTYFMRACCLTVGTASTRSTHFWCAVAIIACVCLNSFVRTRARVYVCVWVSANVQTYEYISRAQSTYLLTSYSLYYFTFFSCEWKN